MAEWNREQSDSPRTTRSRLNPDLHLTSARLMRGSSLSHTYTLINDPPPSWQVAYGRFDVSGWSEAPGALCTWNLGKKVDAGASHRKPDVTIDCDSPLQVSVCAFHMSHISPPGFRPRAVKRLWNACAELAMQRKRLAENEKFVALGGGGNCPLQALAFHPTAPALVAGGTLTGALMVWDLSREEDNLRGQSRITDYSHKAPITQVSRAGPLAPNPRT